MSRKSIKRRTVEYAEPLSKEQVESFELIPELTNAERIIVRHLEKLATSLDAIGLGECAERARVLAEERKFDSESIGRLCAEIDRWTHRDRSVEKALAYSDELRAQLVKEFDTSKETE